MEASSTVKFVIGLVIFAVILANVMPGALNTLSGTTLTNTTANALWILIPFIFVASILYKALAQ